MSNAVSTNAKLRKVATITILWVLCIGLFYTCACWAIWDGGYFLTSKLNTDPPRWKPSVKDIVGKWQLTEESIKFARDYETLIPPHEIEFFADGTFKATSFPKVWGWSDEKPNFVFYTGTGTWRFDKMGFKPWAIRLYYDHYDDFFDIDYYFLRGREAPYEIDGTPFMFQKE